MAFEVLEVKGINISFFGTAVQPVGCLQALRAAPICSLAGAWAWAWIGAWHTTGEGWGALSTRRSLLPAVAWEQVDPSGHGSFLVAPPVPPPPPVPRGSGVPGVLSWGHLGPQLTVTRHQEVQGTR